MGRRIMVRPRITRRMQIAPGAPAITLLCRHRRTAPPAKQTVAAVSRNNRCDAASRGTPPIYAVPKPSVASMKGRPQHDGPQRQQPIL
jgi:hypothetical protein